MFVIGNMTLAIYLNTRSVRHKVGIYVYHWENLAKAAVNVTRLGEFSPLWQHFKNICFSFGWFI